MRQLVSTILLIAMPVVAIMATPLPPPLALMVVAKPVLIVVVLFAWDVAVLVGTWRARRRMLRGLPPVRAGIDYGVGPDVWLVTVPADDPYRAQDRRELVARGSPEAAARVLAGNLVRRTCGIAVLGLVIAAFSFCCVTCPHHGAPGTMHTALNSIRSATILYMNAHEGRCPSVDDLKAEKGTEDDFTMPPQE
ncbi:MAG TPA: resistance to Congo red protein [Polyangiaceae bacterium]